LPGSPFEIPRASSEGKIGVLSLNNALSYRGKSELCGGKTFETAPDCPQ
jgi:hypothetical protein